LKGFEADPDLSETRNFTGTGKIFNRKRSAFVTVNPLYFVKKVVVK
jgi:hypothetical protein